ncbi:cyclic lactone autoinducer peptide [Paenibacillus sp. y28]
MIKRLAFQLSSMLGTIAAISLISTSSWLFTHQPIVPKELKK